MNDGLDKKVALGLALTLALLLATGVYWFTEPSRQKGTAEEYKLAAAEIFAQNCTCHGELGLGGVGPSLRITRLDEEGLVKTISRGVTIMPTWAREEGGTLNSFQIQQLAAFILDWNQKLVDEAFVLHPIASTPNPPPPEAPPPPYAGMKNPLPWGDKTSVEMGELIYNQVCLTQCHWLEQPLPQLPDVRDPVWAANLEEHADYYFWFLSESPMTCHQGPAMPAFKRLLPEKQRWEVLDYLRSMGTLGCSRGVY
jgi:mono/diheme cytochrome c family protein